MKVRRTLKIEQRENSKETRNDFEESSKNYSEMYTKIHQEITDIVSDIFVNERLSSEIDLNSRKAVEIQILESLILAQDERWRRA